AKSASSWIATLPPAASAVRKLVWSNSTATTQPHCPPLRVARQVTPHGFLVLAEAKSGLNICALRDAPLLALRERLPVAHSLAQAQSIVGPLHSGVQAGG